MKTRKFIVDNPFKGDPKISDFTLIEEEMRPLEGGEYLCEAIYWSVDPYMRVFDIKRLKNCPMVGSSVVKVLESRHNDFKPGDLVFGYFGWQTHCIQHGDENTPFITVKPYNLPDFGNLSPSLALGVLGMTGNAAYFGFLEICEPMQGETVVVNAAAGAVGMHVGQIAKFRGCRVVGFTGSDEKVSWLTKDLGFDAAFNYKTVNITEALQQSAPQGVDCYFDNVGGELSSKVLEQMNQFGRIAICGSLCSYNATAPTLAPIIQGTVIRKNLKMEGFIANRWSDRWLEGIQKNLQWIQEGKIQYKETVTEGFENMPQAFISMMKGENIGKAVVKA